MTKAEKRRKEFVWYHIHGDGDCNGQVLRVYAQLNNLDRQACFDLAYFYATTYCVVSAIYLLNHRKEIVADYRAFAKENKPDLIFQSDRKYVKMLDNFERMLDVWRRELRSGAPEFDRCTLADPSTIDTEKALSKAEKWYFFKRFSAYLFIETYCDILDLRATRVTGLDYEGDAMTFAGGLFYVLGDDKDAIYIHENRKLPVTRDAFEESLQTLQRDVLAAGGDDSLVKLETSLCAYEKFFKGTRYNGYYADRQLGEVTKLRNNPKFVRACEEVLLARSIAINDAYLGELHGWSGIRKELKKSYQKTGRVVGATEAGYQGYML